MMLPYVCSVIDTQMTSKCGKNKEVAYEAIAECVTDDTQYRLDKYLIITLERIFIFLLAI